MKIKEALKIINATDTVSAKADGDYLLMYQRDKIYLAWFLRFPTKANNWSAIARDWHGLLGVYTQDLARVMDVIQRLLDTPVKERFPEKKYTIQVIANCTSAYLNCNKGDNHMMFCSDIETDHVKTRFTQSEIDELKQCDDLAIDWDKAIIKEVKDDED